MNKFMNPESEVQPYIKSFETNDQDIENATNNNNNMYLYSKLGQDISRHIDELNLNITKTKKYTNILRLVIQSMGGLEWNDQTSISEKHSSNNGLFWKSGTKEVVAIESSCGVSFRRISS
jgi:hypothetical protein